MQKISKIFLPIFVGALLAVTTQSFGVNVKLNPIKPTSGKPVTDEQQGILAVRKAKASVVNITGEIKSQNTATITFEGTEVSGTGFVWSADGYIITNQHVVNGSGDYSVSLADGTTYPATIVGTDKYNDIALLKISASALTPAALGDSDGLETGQSVFAIGNSLGKYQNTVTRGVVSGLSRALSVGTQEEGKPRLQNLIQTDASINPGNSGGPLVNMAGEVVGMNTLIDTEGQGVGFAIPVNLIKSEIDQLKTLGKASRPYLGITFATITKKVKDDNNLKVSQGAVIIKIAPGSPAALAGLWLNDIITEVNHTPITEQNELDTAILKYQAGNQILVTLTRNGQQLDLPVILGEYK